MTCDTASSSLGSVSMKRAGAEQEDSGLPHTDR